jgi:predicted cobalt transporter CbtA
MAAPLIERRIRWAGILVAAGLILQLITFIWVHPLAFMAFLMISCPLVAIGIVVYLYALIAVPSSPLHGENGSQSNNV